RGGRAILLVDNYSILDWDRIQAIDQALQQEKFSLRPIDTGLKDWLKFYGFELRDGVVLDRVNHKMFPIRAANQRFPELADMRALLNVRELDADKKPTGQLNQEEITLAGIGALAFLVPTPMQLDAEGFKERQPGAKLQGLAWTSKESWIVESPGDTLPMY